MRDAICGHSPRTVADEYETPSLGDMAVAMKKFTRYVLAQRLATGVYLRWPTPKVCANRT